MDFGSKHATKIDIRRFQIFKTAIAWGITITTNHNQSKQLVVCVSRCNNEMETDICVIDFVECSNGRQFPFSPNWKKPWSF